MPKRRLNPLTVFDVPPEGGAFVPTRGDQWYVDTFNGVAGDTGKSWDSALSTMAAALTKAQTGDTIYFTGDIREELTGSNLKFDITIVGAGRTHHPDQPTSAYHPGASTWRPPTSPTATTPLIKVRGRGWRFVNILFDCPVDAAAIYLERNGGSDVSEYDAGHAQVIGCRFASGKVGIENNGGAAYCTVKNNHFHLLTETGGAGIKCTSTGQAIPLGWIIEDNHFHNNASHILSSVSYSTIRNNIFGRFTATLSVDVYNQPSAGQGEYNIITRNYLTGTYGATAYPAGSNNEWGGNNGVLTGGVTAADPV